MSITAKIIADSINPAGVRLTSFILTYPRFIHSEFMTHRVFSRNAASSRAIPISKQIEAVRDNPVQIEFWGKNQSGMQALEEMGESEIDWAKSFWGAASSEMVGFAESIACLGAHKQIVNRLLESFSYITVLATATDAGLANFFVQRAHPDAQPEFQVLAYRMLDVYMRNKPKALQWGEWHIPFGDMMPEGLLPEDRLRVATARACWTSYNRHGKTEFDLKDAFERHDQSIQLRHWSPFEHCAQAVDGDYPKSNFDIGGKASGFMQYRKQFDSENVTRIDPAELMAKKPDWISVS